MWIAEFSIKKPVMTVMVIGGLMLLGYISIDRLGVDLFPKVEFPYITVQVWLPGASPEVMETEVTDPLEEEINATAAIQSMISTSTDGFTMVMVGPRGVSSKFLLQAAIVTAEPIPIRAKRVFFAREILTSTTSWINNPRYYTPLARNGYAFPSNERPEIFFNINAMSFMRRFSGCLRSEEINPISRWSRGGLPGSRRGRSWRL